MKRIAEKTWRYASIAIAVAITSQHAHAVDLKKRLDVSTDTREPEFGQIYYDYHLGRHFSALNKVIEDKEKGLFSADDPTTEILLGDLYTEFGLPREGDAALSRVQAQDIPSSTRNAPWLRYAKLLYKMGNDAPSENYLRKPPSNLTSYQESERRLMLANILIRKKSYPEAINLLTDMRSDGITASYGLYNLGIAYIQNNKPEVGIFHLNEVIRLAGTDDENLNLKDKAALAIAYKYLQDKKYALARESLLRVRLEGPYSNSALLSLAYSYYLNKDLEQTLPAALELQSRNPADPAVQEAFLLAARVYEDLGARTQAIASYRIGALTLREQLAQLERSALRVDEANWPDVLAPQRMNTIDADPLNLKTIPATNNAITAGLFSKLFASPAFNEGFRQYQQLGRLQTLIEERLRDITALQEVAQTLESRRPELAAKEAQLKVLRDKYVGLVKKWQAIQIRAKRLGTNADAYSEAATQAETARLQQINKLIRKVSKLGLDEKQSQELLTRLNRLKDLTLFEVARHAASRDEIYEKLQDSTNQLRETKARLATVETLLADNKAVVQRNNSQKFPSLKAKAEKLQGEVADAKLMYQNYLRSLAKNLIDERRQRLTAYIAETYLGMERTESKLAPADTAPTPKASEKL
ncbi:tetratricopeptide repeat protein [Agitococcus lubricus]|uniref:Tetratricopeptide repeat protein n=1 Tax=Agitococcus lubricus TaxID=1077255 RepID=A0A2T5IWB8_9GAMM|nr:tetratricopeptide repeat protein [Agitococcus lubricus]PTQ88180.1 tetratricopeptide repeat protein [Agitococcus lubricus]